MKRRFSMLVMCVLAVGCVAASPGAALPANVTADVTSLPSANPTSQQADVAPESTGQIYYVSPAGDDSHPGTRDAPWQHPGYGSRQLQPGDTLILLPGRYALSRFDEDILHPSSGTADAWITIRGEEGSLPMLAGGDNLLTAIDLSGSSYVRLENLEITHDPSATGPAAFFRDGIQAMGTPTHHLVLKGLYVHHLDEFGLGLQNVSDVLVTESRFEYCGFGAMGGPTATAGGWQNVRIERSVLSYSGHYYQGSDGADRPYDRPDGFGIEPSSGPIEIVQTIAAHNFGDGFDSKAANTTIDRSISANNSCDGVKLWGTGSRVINTLIYGRGDGDPEVTPWSAIVIDSEEVGATFSLENVTVDDALGGNYLMYVQYDRPEVSVELTLHNSIFSATGPSSAIYVGEASEIHADHNLFYIPNTDVVLYHGVFAYTVGNLGSLGQENHFGDPRFVEPAWGSDGDYHLSAGSPAIDTGAAGPAVDLDGRSRDGSPDLGAYEYVRGAELGYLPVVLQTGK